MPLDARRFRRLCISAFATAGMAACSSGGFPGLAEGPSPADRMFLSAAGNWDRNKDGVVTCDEWKAYAAELFDGADTGRKGYLTPDDWKKVIGVDRMFETVDFKYYDANNDGKVERAEFVDRSNRAFELADRDHDCDLTSVELTGARMAAKPADKIVPAGSESGDKPGHTGAGGAGRVP